MNHFTFPINCINFFYLSALKAFRWIVRKKSGEREIHVNAVFFIGKLHCDFQWAYNFDVLSRPNESTKKCIIKLPESEVSRKSNWMKMKKNCSVGIVRWECRVAELLSMKLAEVVDRFGLEVYSSQSCSYEMSISDVWWYCWLLY